MTLETLFNSIDGSIPAEYDAARAAKVAEIAAYLAGLVRPGLEGTLAEDSMSKAEEQGRINGDEITAEIAGRYTISGNPLPFTI